MVGKAMAFTILLSLVMLTVAGMAVREIVLFGRKRAEYPVRRLTLRISTAVMLLFLLVSLLVGVRVFHLDTYQGIIGLFLAFWGCVALLAGAIICLTIADLRMIGDETFADTNHYWRDIAETIAEHEKHETQPATPGPAGPDDPPDA
jgi:hypothetical protein